MNAKICRQCGILRDADQFHRRRDKDGAWTKLESYCRDCVRERTKTYVRKRRLLRERKAALS